MNFRLETLVALIVFTASAHAQPAPQPPPQLEFKIDPTFVDLGETTFAGIATYAVPASPQFPELWKDGFHDVTAEADNGQGAKIGLDTEKYAYGLELFPPSFEEKRKFTYMACFAVVDSRKVPLHLVQRTIPSAKYAVFKVPGGIAGLGKTFSYIYTRWLPQSGYDRSFPFDLERYDLTPGAGNAKDVVMDVLVPVAPRK